MSLAFDAEKVLLNARAADTADLLDRVTAYRAGLEAAAVPVLEGELHRRGVTAEQIADHDAECRRECLYGPDGVALECTRCRRPAVGTVRVWQYLFWVVPVFPRRVRVCREHGAPSPAV